MITPAMAAEVNAEAQIEAQAMSRLADFDFVQSADVNEATFSLDGESVLVQNLSETTTLDEISKAELADVIEQVATTREIESDSETDLVSFYYVIDDKVYNYEEFADNVDNQESTLCIYDLSDEPISDFAKQVMNDNDSISNISFMDNVSPMGASNKLTVVDSPTIFDVGIDARLNIWNSSVNYMSATLDKIDLSAFKGIDNRNMYNYIYLGFSAPRFESDLGFQVSRQEGYVCGYNPYWLVTKTPPGSSAHSTYLLIGQNSYEDNGRTEHIKYFLTTEPIKMMVHRNNLNYNHQLTTSLEGKAVYVHSNIQQTGNVKIVMTNANYTNANMPTFNKWKIVNSLTPTDPKNIPSGCESKSSFSNIKVNESRISFSTCDAEIVNYGNPQKYGYVDYTPKTGGTYLDTLEFFLKTK